MGSEIVTGVGVDFYKWMLGTLSLSRRGGGYRRLNPPVRKRVRLARLGKKRARSLKIRRVPRLRLISWLSPFTLLARLRDAYVRLLQAASDKFVLSDGPSVAAFPALPSNSTTPSVPFGDFKAQDRQLNHLLQLYLARTRTQLILPHDD